MHQKKPNEDLKLMKLPTLETVDRALKGCLEGKKLVSAFKREGDGATHVVLVVTRVAHKAVPQKVC